jgi:6,7-dimethyl-8-ribityllumazine synthase
MQDVKHETPSARPLRVAVVTSRYHADITASMRDAASEIFLKSGGDAKSLHHFEAPGTFELTAICNALAQQQRIDAIVAIGCVITGETTHDQYIAQSVVQGLTSITVQTGTPIAFGILTCQTIEQARTRSIDCRPPQLNKGAEAMLAAIEAANTIRQVYRTGGIG